MTISLWDWNKSNGQATEQQVKRAYKAITNQGATKRFNYRVWNDMVEFVDTILKELYRDSHQEPPEGDSYWWSGDFKGTTILRKSETLMHSKDKTLSAQRFNSLFFQLKYPYWKWWTDPGRIGYIEGKRYFLGMKDTESVELSDNVYGWYFLELIDTANYTAKILNGTDAKSHHLQASDQSVLEHIATLTFKTIHALEMFAYELLFTQKVVASKLAITRLTAGLKGITGGRIFEGPIKFDTQNRVLFKGDPVYIRFYAPDPALATQRTALLKQKVFLEVNSRGKVALPKAIYSGGVYKGKIDMGAEFRTAAPTWLNVSNILVGTYHTVNLYATKVVRLVSDNIYGVWIDTSEFVVKSATKLKISIDSSTPVMHPILKTPSSKRLDGIGEDFGVITSVDRLSTPQPSKLTLMNILTGVDNLVQGLRTPKALNLDGVLLPVRPLIDTPLRVVKTHKLGTVAKEFGVKIISMFSAPKAVKLEVNSLTNPIEFPVVNFKSVKLTKLATNQSIDIVPVRPEAALSSFKSIKINLSLDVVPAIDTSQFRVVKTSQLPTLHWGVVGTGVDASIKAPKSAKVNLNFILDALDSIEHLKEGKPHRIKPTAIKVPPELDAVVQYGKPSRQNTLAFSPQPEFIAPLSEADKLNLKSTSQEEISIFKSLLTPYAVGGMIGNLVSTVTEGVSSLTSSIHSKLVGTSNEVITSVANIGFRIMKEVRSIGEITSSSTASLDYLIPIHYESEVQTVIAPTSDIQNDESVAYKSPISVALECVAAFGTVPKRHLDCIAHEIYDLVISLVGLNKGVASNGFYGDLNINSEYTAMINLWHIQSIDCTAEEHLQLDMSSTFRASNTVSYEGGTPLMLEVSREFNADISSPIETTQSEQLLPTASLKTESATMKIYYNPVDEEDLPVTSFAGFESQTITNREKLREEGFTHTFDCSTGFEFGACPVFACSYRIGELKGIYNEGMVTPEFNLIEAFTLTEVDGCYTYTCDEVLVDTNTLVFMWKDIE